MQNTNDPNILALNYSLNTEQQQQLKAQQNKIPLIKNESQDFNVSNDYNDDEDDYDDEEQSNHGAQNNSQNKQRPKGDLKCVVCDAPANGYNFDAITCESCKAFFRRNAFRPLNMFRCSNNNQCIITVQTRKKCKKCRIYKCFNEGMRKDWIMTEMEREEKRRKIEENRKKKATSTGPYSNEYQINSVQSQDQFGLSRQDSLEQSFLLNQSTNGVKPIRRRRRRRRHSLFDQQQPQNGNQSQEETKSGSNTKAPNNGFVFSGQGQFNSTTNTVPMSSFYQHSNNYANFAQQKQQQHQQHHFHSAQSAYQATSSLSYTSYNPSQSPPQSIYSPSRQSTPLSNAGSPPLDLTESRSKIDTHQQSQINAIRMAYKQAIQLVKAQGTPRNPEDINTTINLTELGVRRIIFYFKLIADFRNLEHDLMVKLLKQSMMCILQIHGVNSYNKLDNTFKEPDTDDTPFSAQSLETVYGAEIYKLTISITMNLYELCNEDMTFIKILMLVVLFDAQNENLTDEERKMIKKIQEKYLSLLLAHLNFTYGHDRAILVYKGMMNEIERIDELGRWFEKAVVEKSNYEYVRPLMKEVFSFPSDNTPPSSIASTTSTSSSSSSSSSGPHSACSISASPAAQYTSIKLETSATGGDGTS